MLDAHVPYVQLVAGFTLAVYLLHTYLDARQVKVGWIGGALACLRRKLHMRLHVAPLVVRLPPDGDPPTCGRRSQALRKPSPPPEVAHLYDGDRFAKQQVYQLEKMRFSMVHGLVDTALGLAMLMRGFLPRTWLLAGALLGHAGRAGEVQQSVVWVLLMSAASLALGLPWSVYGTFVLEQKYGFNKTTARTFVLDQVKSVRAGGRAGGGGGRWPWRGGSGGGG